MTDTGGRGDLAPEIQLRIDEAREAERLRLAQEIHDGPAQALTNALFHIELVERALERDTETGRRELAVLRERLRGDLAELRGYMANLRPPRLLDLGLVEAIEESAANLAALSGIEVTTELAAPATLLGEAAQTAVLRIVQEALQNVRKHAGATRVHVATRIGGGRWTAEVGDDGKGIREEDRHTGGSNGFGMGVMRERAAMVGGSFAVRSVPGKGTVVTVSIPLDEEVG